MGPAFLMTYSPTDTATITLAPIASVLLVLGGSCLLPPLFHLVAFLCVVKSGDLSKTELIIKQCRQPSSILRALGCSFMASDTV